MTKPIGFVTRILVERYTSMVRVQAGFFSFTPVIGESNVAEERRYQRWHLLDHMPEQQRIAGIQCGLRWVADERCRAARLVARAPLDHLGSVVHYLFGSPVEQTLAEFLELGAQLREVGRFPVSRPSLRLAALSLLQYRAAPRAMISAEVVPFRPHRGVIVLVEEPVGDTRPDDWLRWLHAEHHPSLLSAPGVAGAWTFGAPYAHPFTADSPAWAANPHYVTLVYLDEDPVEVTERLAPSLRQRWSDGSVVASFAGPLRSMIRWEAWTDEPSDEQAR